MVPAGRWYMTGGGWSLGTCPGRVRLPYSLYPSSPSWLHHEPISFFLGPSPMICCLLQFGLEQGSQPSMVWELRYHELPINFPFPKLFFLGILITVMKSCLKQEDMKAMSQNVLPGKGVVNSSSDLLSSYLDQLYLHKSKICTNIEKGFLSSL